MTVQGCTLLLSVVVMLTSCATPNTKSVTVPPLKKYEFSLVEELMEQEPRPLVVFLHAEWCTYCKNMEQTTLQNKSVVSALNNDYYFISFDGESRDEIIFRGRPYQYVPTGRSVGTHELAKDIGTINGSLTYPTIVIFNPKYEIIFQHDAFLSAAELKAVLEKGSNS